MLQSRRAEMFPESTSVAGLRPGDQFRLAEAIETHRLFRVLRVHTIMAFLGPAEYGGNRKQAGWTLIGFAE